MNNVTEFRGTVYLINALVVMQPDRILRTIGAPFGRNVGFVRNKG